MRIPPEWSRVVLLLIDIFRHFIVIVKGPKNRCQKIRIQRCRDLLFGDLKNFETLGWLTNMHEMLDKRLPDTKLISFVVFSFAIEPISTRHGRRIIIMELLFHVGHFIPIRNQHFHLRRRKNYFAPYCSRIDCFLIRYVSSWRLAICIHLFAEGSFDKSWPDPCYICFYRYFLFSHARGLAESKGRIGWWSQMNATSIKRDYKESLVLLADSKDQRIRVIWWSSLSESQNKSLNAIIGLYNRLHSLSCILFTLHLNIE